QQALALCELARADAELGRTADAAAAIVRATALGTDNSDARFELALVAARTDEHALRTLADAAGHNFEHAWRARFAIAELTHDATAMRSLADEAHARGYL